MPTTILDVRGSYPEPPDAKQTPVTRSLSWSFGSKYAGRSSLMPNSWTDIIIRELQQILINGYLNIVDN